MKRSKTFKCMAVAGMALAGCKPAPDAALLKNEASVAISRAEPESAPRPAGLTEDERLQIQQDILGRFMTRTFRSGPIYAPRPADCANAFSVQNPTIADAMLGESTGKVRVLVQITLHTIPPKRHRVPTDECYGFTAPQVTIGEPMRVPFEFRVEKWQTGWRLGQPQPGEQFQLAAR